MGRRLQMKRRLRKLGCLFVAVMLVTSVVGCGKKGQAVGMELPQTSLIGEAPKKEGPSERQN